MKKLICLVLAMLLCVGCAAMAMAASSKTTSNMTNTSYVVPPIEIPVQENLVIGTGEGTQDAQAQAQCDQLVEELAAVGSVAEVFGDLKDDEGETIDLVEILGTDKPVVNEVTPLVIKNYNPASGNMKINFTFATPYQKNEPVVVVIRVVDPKTGKLTQYAIKGIGSGVDSGIEVEFPPEVMEAIQNGTATMAVVSK